MKKTLASILSLLCLCAASRADGPTPILTPGQPAPALDIAEWVKGTPVTDFKDGKVHVVEFWATWCEASQRAVSVLRRLQAKHADDLRILAISARDSEGESIETVRLVAEKMAGIINYSVAFDNRRRTTRRWMDRAEENSIPTAFVIDRSGVVTWIGNPLWPQGEFEEAAERTLAGEFGPEARLASKEKWRKRMEETEALETEASRAFDGGQEEQGLKALDRLIQLNPGGASGYVSTKIHTLLRPGRNPAPAYAEARRALGDVLKDEPEALNDIAWWILTEPKVAPRDLDLALDLAARAAELTNSADAPILDTLALAYASKGVLNKAIELQTKAVQLAAENAQREEYQDRLEEYRAEVGTRRSKPKEPE